MVDRRERPALFTPHSSLETPLVTLIGDASTGCLAQMIVDRPTAAQLYQSFDTLVQAFLRSSTAEADGSSFVIDSFETDEWNTWRTPQSEVSYQMILMNRIVIFLS